MTAPAEDGNLPDALRHLDDAVSALCDPKPQTLHDGTLTWLDSAYVQLRDAVPGSKRDRTGVSASQPPVWVDALQLLQEIDTAVAVWERPFPQLPGDLTQEPEPVTVLRVRAIQRRSWRPQDCRNINQITEAVKSWADNIETLLTDKPKWTLPAACPQCNKKTVYRHDSSGELVRQPALQIGTMGCQCQNCRAGWSPDQFVFLATRLLGYDLPEGVLE
jgi:hypothetical protein